MRGQQGDAHVHPGTGTGTPVYPDAYDSYTHLERPHATGTQGQREGARDAAGDGIREGHTNRVRGGGPECAPCCAPSAVGISAA